MCSYNNSPSRPHIANRSSTSSSVELMFLFLNCLKRKQMPIKANKINRVQDYASFQFCRECYPQIYSRSSSRMIISRIFPAVWELECLSCLMPSQGFQDRISFPIPKEYFLKDRLLLPSNNLNSKGNIPDSFGIFPLRWLVERSSCCSRITFPSWGGIAPEILLLEMFRLVSMWHCPHFSESSP